MATGANANTWGTNTNNNLDVIDAFMSGYISKSVAGSANITLSTANASDTAESSNRTIELTGALTGDIVVFIPATESKYTFFNNTTGSQTLTIAATGHQANGTLITQGAHTTVYCDGASDFNVEISSSTDAAALNKGTLPDARFPATLPAVSGANLTNLDAADLASGTVPDARFPATLPAADGSALTALNASNIGSGTLGSDRLPTVPTSKGGTGLTSVGTEGQVLSVTAPGALAFADAAGGVVGNVTTTQQLTSTGSFTSRSDAMFGVAFGLGGGGSGGCGGHGFGQGQGQPGGNTTFPFGAANGGPQGAAGFPSGGANSTPGGAASGAFGEAGTASQAGNATSSGGNGAVSPFSPLGNGGKGAGPAGGEEGSGGGAGGVYRDIVGNYTKGSPVSVTVGTGGTGRPGNRGTGQAGNAGKAQFTEYFP
tara:strand:+ start:1032 stop:2315 length:1284 start_codon:yes stop_codon:yes gene_type:complete